MRGLCYTHAAQGDLITFFEERSNQTNGYLAGAAVEAIMGRCEDIARFPDMGRRRSDLDGLGLQARSISQDGRLIVYVKRGDMIHVVRVLREEGG